VIPMRRWKKIVPNEVDQWTGARAAVKRVRKRGREGRWTTGDVLVIFYRYPVDWAENLTDWFRGCLLRSSCLFSSSFDSGSLAEYAVGQLT